jgi:hypothetical protein
MTNFNGNSSRNLTGKASFQLNNLKGVTLIPL